MATKYDGTYDGIYGVTGVIPPVDDLTLYYVGLLIVQYFNKPKAKAMLMALIGEVIADEIVAKVRDAFDIETAVGVQLDRLGEYVNAKRNLYGIDFTRVYFSLPGMADTPGADQVGFRRYGDADSTDLWITYALAEEPVYTMTDEEFRRYIKYMAKKNHIDHSVKVIDDLLFEFFGAAVTLTDNGDMTITYQRVAGSDTLYDILELSNNFPKPAGVQVTIA